MWIRQDWAHSNAEQNTPSFDQSSELHQANENSIRTAYRVHREAKQHATNDILPNSTYICYINKKLAYRFLFNLQQMDRSHISNIKFWKKRHKPYRSACTRMVSENSWRLTNALSTFILKSFLQHPWDSSTSQATQPHITGMQSVPADSDGQ